MEAVAILRNKALSCQVCALKELTPAEVGEWTNRLNPAGTENGWSVHEEVPPVACANDAGRLHWVLVC